MHFDALERKIPGNGSFPVPGKADGSAPARIPLELSTLIMYCLS